MALLDAPFFERLPAIWKAKSMLIFGTPEMFNVRSIFIVSLTLLSLVGCSSEIIVHPYDARVLESLKHLEVVPTLTESGRVIELNVEGKEISDEDLRSISELTELKRLSLYGSTFDQAGLKGLASAGRLEALGIGKTAITDQTLIWMAEIPSLRWLWIFECDKLTPDGVAKFRQLRPDVEVYQ
jgi:hypothetical protein